uniref:Uncharacterized protein n=1 Tax=Arundo donax TaxID=35708 RepID=A0A0A9FBE3_ARUDO
MQRTMKAAPKMEGPPKKTSTSNFFKKNSLLCAMSIPVALAQINNSTEILMHTTSLLLIYCSFTSKSSFIRPAISPKTKLSTSKFQRCTQYFGL